MKTISLSLAAAAVLFSLPALADHDAYPAQQYGQQGQYNPQGHAAPPPPGNAEENCDRDGNRGGEHEARMATRGGEYELRTVQKWQEGYYQQVWVPGDCFGRHLVKVCRPGFYRQDWVPGRYVTAQEYVWVDRHPGHGWGRFNSHRR